MQRGNPSHDAASRPSVSRRRPLRRRLLAAARPSVPRVVTSPSGETVAARLRAVRDQVDRAARDAGRRPEDITLVAVSKTHPAEAVEAAIAAGQRVFGENRVQEAKAKFPPLRDAHPDLRLHLIGPLQTNKAREAVALFDCIESVDRPKLAHALAREAERTGHRPDCLVQVNTGEEPQKAGVAPDAAEALIRLVRDELGLPLTGLMCIPPLEEPAAPHFALLREMAKAHDLPVLSMGMSADFETAIHLGATHVRLGTAIFGPRQQT